MNIVEAAKSMKEGPTVHMKRPHWRNMSIVSRDEKGCIGLWSNGKYECAPHFSVEDLLADDWEIIE